MPHATLPGIARIGTDEQRSASTTEVALDGRTLLALEPTDTGTCAQRILDLQDARIVWERMRAMNMVHGPRVGDFVDFADGKVRRISHAYYVADGWESNSFQTSDLEGLWTGRYYLGNFGASFSGGLRPSIPGDTLTLTDELRDGSAWIFHHDHHTAHNGVDFLAPFRVFTSTLEAN